jgi:hypothetical protein
MPRSKLAPFNRNKFPLTLAGGLRATFDAVLSTPLPEGLVTLMSRLGADSDAHQKQGEKHGPSATR